ncbi:MAG: hypothetical protein M9962_15220 [Oligoflexia bacterium]|nr:hypothetical protein [Oligoflexia bacterium]
MILLLLLIGWLLGAQVSYSAVAAEEQQSYFSLSSLRDKTNLSYGALILGPTVRKINGDTQGKGHYISLRNYLSAGFEFRKDWELEVGNEFRQTFRPKDPKKPDREDFEFRDLSVGIGVDDIIESGSFSLDGKLRYYIPTSKYTLSKVGKADDSANGTFRIGINPSMSFFDRDLYLAIPVDFYRSFAKGTPKIHKNYSVKFKPLASYRLSQKWKAKVEYSSGDLYHSTDGKWTKFNDPFTGQKIYLGASWNPTYKLGFSPSLAWGANGSFQLKNTELSLYMSYYIL